MQLKTVVIRGQGIAVEVSSEGLFRASVGETGYSAETLERLEQILSKAVKGESEKVSVPFFRWDGEKLLRGAVIGVHASNDNLLIRFEGKKGTVQQYGGHRVDRAYLGLSEAEQHEYVSLCQTLNAASKAVAEFEDAHAFSPRKKLEEAMKKAAGVKEPAKAPYISALSVPGGEPGGLP